MLLKEKIVVLLMCCYKVDDGQWRNKKETREREIERYIYMYYIQFHMISYIKYIGTYLRFGMKELNVDCLLAADPLLSVLLPPSSSPYYYYCNTMNNRVSSFSLQQQPTTITISLLLLISYQYIYYPFIYFIILLFSFL